MKNKKGFTLVELLAVIAILAILVIIALPNVINMYTKAKKEAFLTETKKLYSEVEKNYISSSITGTPSKVINSEDNTKLDMTGEKLKYCVILNGQGKVKSMKVSNGEWVASLDNNKKLEDLSIDDLEEGNLDGYKCSQYTPNVPKATNCTFDGKLVQGAEYVNGQYTYRYKQEAGGRFGWDNIYIDGWGVQLTDGESTAPVTTKLCTYINDKPVVSMDSMFHTSKPVSIDFSSFNTTNIRSMQNMFVDNETKSLDLSNFDTSNVTSMSGMFAYSKATELDLSNFDTSKVTTMSSMFENSMATSIIGLKNFDTSKVRYMWGTFKSSKAKELDLLNFDTSNVIDMTYTFYGSYADTLDLSSFNTSKVVKMLGMFELNKATKIIGLNKFDTRKVTDMTQMFNYSSVENLDLSSFDLSSLKSMGRMFQNCSAKSIVFGKNVNTNNVTDMSGTFTGTNVTELDLSGFNTKNVTTMTRMFWETKATNIIGLEKFNTSNVTSMYGMFEGAKVTTLDLSSFDTSKVTNMGNMFYWCPNLKTIYAGDKFVTTNVTSSNYMFIGSSNLVGGNGTKYNSSYIDKTYARIDAASTPGYFTKK